jgi:alpha-beta hydrolase superfamily lysophospholipase
VGLDPWLRWTAIFLLVSSLHGCSGTQLQPWQTVKLTQEFAASDAEDIFAFDDYLRLEDRLFSELEDKVYSVVGTGPEYALVRYSAGSAADPRQVEPNWNRSFQMEIDAPTGAVLLLHGMSDSPYSLRALALALRRQGYWVLGLRLPGHGTAPSGLKYIAPDDMAAAVRVAMKHLAAQLPGKPVHVIGYSNGATLAIDYALASTTGAVQPVPSSLVLISPSIQVHPTAALAGLKNGLGKVPGMGGLAWLQIQPEFDPYKYNSFATNAADVVHRLTRSVDGALAAKLGAGSGSVLPPTLVFKSAVDATVSTEAVVDRFLGRLAPNRHELVLFDINRAAAKSSLLISDPGPLTNRLLEDDGLPFSLMLITNQSPETNAVVARRKPPFSSQLTAGMDLALSWPAGVISLSHVALPFAPDDPLYGQRSPGEERRLFLGGAAVRGERGLLKLPDDWFFRMRYNPFYPVLEQRVIEWLGNNGNTS